MILLTWLSAYDKERGDMESENTYSIKVEIISEAVFNSGEEEKNTVNQKVLADENGFVYMHAKTFKGQLKKQALWLCKRYENIDLAKQNGGNRPSVENRFLKSIEKLFGLGPQEYKFIFSSEGDKDPKAGELAIEPRQGIMKVGNLELDERIRSYFMDIQSEDIQAGYYRISPADILQAQTNIRTGIRIENGVAKENMMRTYHTVKDGLVFYSRLRFDEEPYDYIEDLNKVIKLFRKIGAGTNRGRGKVKASLLVNGQEYKPERGAF